MPFDDETRKRLQQFVSDARTLLTDEFTRQLQHEYGLDPASGEVTELGRLGHLDDTRRETARLLRETLEHYLAASESAKRPDVLDRIVREQAFTVLNRLCALRMAEAREIVIESIAKGYESKGFQLYSRLADAALGETGDAYRSYLYGLFDEFAVDLPVLFDRFSVQGRLFPREAALLRVLQEINHVDIESLWAEDETIGWIYQYFNSKKERKRMRDESTAPRNSRELAVRNQFFTPRYVVEFLTDNTLGRIWYEMRKGDTKLKEKCRYMLRRPVEIFLGAGESEPVTTGERKPRFNVSDLSRANPIEADSPHDEEVAQPVFVPFRELKDPRDVKMLDPACGSMHFGLYAFDLFEQIYVEAWELEGADRVADVRHPAELRTLRQTYGDKLQFLRDVPRLIIERNIHGIDIDPRAVQIAGLSLWLRAHKSWHIQRVKPQDRPPIRRSNIACAEPMPGEASLLDEFLVDHLAADPEGRLLAQLVRGVFDAMKLAGETGLLLKIEHEIAASVAEAKTKWLTRSIGTQRGLFLTVPEASQKEAALQVAGITDETFWDEAEAKIYSALEAYAQRAETDAVQRRRLFAADAARGFAFIDLCRQRYSVVLMNPPFGEATKRTAEFLGTTYECTGHDLFAAFTERALLLLEPAGVLGEISSRVGFFIKTFEKWRSDVVGAHLLVTIADLGTGVLDDATVEAACYVIEKRPPNPRVATPVFRLLTDHDKANSLLTAVSTPADKRRYMLALGDCGVLPLAPWIYWVSPITSQKLAIQQSLEPGGAIVRQGVSTGDNHRFLRNLWEVPPHLIASEPLSQSEFNEQLSTGKRWAVHVSSGSSQPWYSPLTLVIDWEGGGVGLKEYWRSRGEAPSRYIRSEELYFKSGFSWTLRAFRLIPYLIPAGCIPSASRYMGFPKDGLEFDVLALVASNLASCFTRFYGEMFERPKHLVETVKRLPFVELPVAMSRTLESKITEEVKRRRSFFRNFEPFWDFVVPARVRRWCDTGSSNWDPCSFLGESLEAEFAEIYGLSIKELTELQVDLLEAVQSRRRRKQVTKEEDDESGEEEETTYDSSGPAETIALVSYALGCAFGRWDVRLATGERNTPELPDVFEPLPACPPGMLQNDQCLPLVVEDVLHLTSTGEWNYPIDFPWAGILVDDDGHSLDIERRVRQVLQIIWGDESEAVERTPCQLLAVHSLREYFKKTSGGKHNGFFQDHLGRYTMGKRPAPLYWPLSGVSGEYTLWLYYHRLSDQTLFGCVNDFVDPKLKQVGDVAGRLRQKTGRSRDDVAALERLTDFEQELRNFRDELLRIAKFWKPNLNDGVQITAAPLWELFQHKPWRKKLKQTWEELEAGDYDWAHLAYSIWPDRVREKCRSDKSLAIAHALEGLYEEPAAPPKKRPSRRKKAEEVEEGLDAD